MFKKLSLAIYCILTILGLSISAQSATVQVIGKIRSPQGASFNGQIGISLPFAGAVDTNCGTFSSCLIAPSVKRYPIINGVITPAPYLTANGDIQPKGTYYRAYIYDSYGNNLAQSIFVIPTGVTTFDIGAALATTIVTDHVSYINPANLDGNNTWTGNQTFTGTVTFSNTSQVVFNGTTIFNQPLTLAQTTFIGGGTISGADSLIAPAGGPFVWNWPTTSGTYIVGTTFAPDGCAPYDDSGLLDVTNCAKIDSPEFTGDPKAPTPSPGDNDDSLATTNFVHTAFGFSEIQVASTTSPCATGTSSYDNCIDTLTWPHAFASNNYFTICGGVDPNITGSGSTADAPVLNVRSHSTTQVVAVTQTQRSQSAQYTSIICMGILP